MEDAVAAFVLTDASQDTGSGLYFSDFPLNEDGMWFRSMINTHNTAGSRATVTYIILLPHVHILHNRRNKVCQSAMAKILQ